MSTKSENLYFYTTGEAFTNLTRSFLQEGSYETLYQILVDGGLNDELIKEFFLMKLKFKGDTRKNNFCAVSDHSYSKETFNETIMIGIYTNLAGMHLDILDLLSVGKYKKGEYKKYADNIERLFSVFGGTDELLNIIAYSVIKREGYKFFKAPIAKDKQVHGVILKDGKFIACDYDGHKYLYPILDVVGLADSGDWVNDTITLHVSSNQITGMTHVKYGYDSDGCRTVTKEMIDTLFKFRRSLSVYDEHEPMAMTLCHYISNKEKHGGKYNNLAFLQRFYSKKINFPKISKTSLEGVEKQCIRTSPEHSLPGLLESKFDINENSIKEIEETFAQYKDVIKDNKLHYFYQEFIPGVNGVCNYDVDNGFSYAVSQEQGAIVKGKKDEQRLAPEIEAELEDIVKELFDDLRKSMQLEFVVNEGKLYIIQLRFLKNGHANDYIEKPNEEKILIKGYTFSKGNIKVNVNDILVVEEDADSKELLGKKALIVKNQTVFSHILALSKALQIPSIYGTGEFELPTKGTVQFTAYNKEAWVSK
jgi:hypothetical protein